MHRDRALKGRRILVVEDEAATSVFIEDTVSNAGGVVVGPAASVAEALSLIKDENIDCAVLDHRLVDGSSQDIADALIERGVPFVFASGYDRNGIGARYATVPLLEKVFTSDELLQAISSLLATTVSPKGQSEENELLGGAT